MISDSLFLPEGCFPAERSAPSNTAELESAASSGRLIEGRAVMCDTASMTLTVAFGSFVGIIPREEATEGEIKDIAVLTRVGRAVVFTVTELRREGGAITAICSRRRAQEECRRRFISRLVPGDIIPARVTHLEPFGAFVDIGCGIASLISVDRISVSRISHPSDRFREGDSIFAVVSGIDRESGRVTLSHRELLGTWEENAASLKQYSTVSGIVRSVEEYGIFVELKPNLAGLAEKREPIAVGDGCSVFIKSIIPEKMKVKLAIIETHPPTGFVPPLEYAPDARRSRRIDVWRYSPEGCRRIIESRFA